MPDMLTIRQAVSRCKTEGLPVSEYTLRSWIKTGAVPTRIVGKKALLFYPNLVRFLQCADGADNTPATAENGRGVRRVEV